MLILKLLANTFFQIAFILRHILILAENALIMYQQHFCVLSLQFIYLVQMQVYHIFCFFFYSSVFYCSILTVTSKIVSHIKLKVSSNIYVLPFLQNCQVIHLQLQSLFLLMLGFKQLLQPLQMPQQPQVRTHRSLLQKYIF